MDEDKEAELVSWLPKKLAPKVRVVMTMIGDTPPHKSLLTREPQPRQMDLQPLDLDARNELVEEHLGRFNKTLDDTQMQSLLNKASSDNPLWLSIACEELRVFGQFRQLSKKIGQLPDGLLELEKSVLSRFEEENGGPLLVATLCLLETSRSGLLESELLQLLNMREESRLLPPNTDEFSNSSHSENNDDIGEIHNSNTHENLIDRINNLTLSESTTEEMSKDLKTEKKTHRELLPAYKWAAVYRALRPFLRPFGDSGEGRLDFYHRSLSKAVRQKYLHSNDNNKNLNLFHSLWWHKHLADFFIDSEKFERKLEEYPYNLIALNDTKRLQDYLIDWNVFNYLYDEEYCSKLNFFWQKAGGFSEFDTHYTKVIDDLVSFYESTEDNPTTEDSEKILRVVTFWVQNFRFEVARKYIKICEQWEQDYLGKRPDVMAYHAYLSARILDNILIGFNYYSDNQKTMMSECLKKYQNAVSLYDELEETPKNLLRKGRALNRLAFQYSNVRYVGDPSQIMESTGELESFEEMAIKNINRCIDLFKNTEDSFYQVNPCGTIMKEIIN